MKEITSKERFCYIFVICVLGIFLAIICILTFTGVFYGTQTEKISSIPLGSNIVVQVNANDINATSFSLSGGVIPDEKIAQNINIKNNSNEKIYVRVKSVITMMTGDFNIGLDTLSNWVKNDAYTYFLKEINAGESIGCAKNIIINNECNLSSEYKYNIVVIVESLSANLNVKEIWNLPLDFYEQNV